MSYANDLKCIALGCTILIDCFVQGMLEQGSRQVNFRHHLCTSSLYSKKISQLVDVYAIIFPLQATA